MSVFKAKAESLSAGIKQQILRKTKKIPKIAVIIDSNLVSCFFKSKNFSFLFEINAYSGSADLTVNNSLPEYTSRGEKFRFIVFKEQMTQKSILLVSGRKEVWESDIHLNRVARIPRALAFMGIQTFIHVGEVWSTKRTKLGGIFLVKDFMVNEKIPGKLFVDNQKTNEFGPRIFRCDSIYHHKINEDLLNKYKVEKEIIQWSHMAGLETPTQTMFLSKEGIAGVCSSIHPECMCLEQMKQSPLPAFSKIKNIALGVVTNWATGVDDKKNCVHHTKTMLKQQRDLISFISELAKQ